MIKQDLILNILKFDHPVETADFSFFAEKADGLISIHKTEWPVNIHELFPNLNNTIQYLYVNFDPNINDKKLAHSNRDCPSR